MVTLFKDSALLFFDGAMGTMLQSAGLQAGELPELYNLLRPELVREVHRAYLVAGADVVCTNTLQANAEKLAGSGYTVEAVIQAGITRAREAGAKLVAQSIGPLAGMMAPLGDLSFEAAYQLFRQQILAGTQAGADLFLIETQSDLYMAKAAILAAKENSALPVFCTLTFQKDGRTFLGADPATAIHTLQGLGVDCLGANCSLGPAELKPILAEMARHSRLPLLVQANAGLPRLKSGVTTFPVGPEEYARDAKDYVELGVAAIGGCCGTTPRHIAALRTALAGAQRKPVAPRLVPSATSAIKTVYLGGGTIIGERLNPTGNKELQAALRTNNLAPFLALGLAQAEAGAELLDINVGLPGVVEKKLLPHLVEKLQAVIDLPLQLDSVDPAALAAAARVYNGKPIINSVNGKEEFLEQVLPLVKKYGAAVIGLTIDEKGIPTTADQRLDIAKRILNRALALGIPKEDLIIDCLTLTAAAQPEQIPETLKGMDIVKEKLGLATVLGISNVSHGLPRRGRLNSVFLIQGLAHDLDAAIVDPLAPEIQDTLRAWRVLSGKDPQAEAYIRAATSPSCLQTGQGTLATSVAQGNREGVAAETARLLKTESPQQIIHGRLIPALNALGKEYEVGRLFLPQLLRAAEAVQSGLAQLKKSGASLGPPRGEVILASVRGDIHDIGKNIVKLLLENQGYQVLDLGKDVPVETIVAAAKEREAKLVGLSALMTTTVTSMAQTIAALKGQAPSCRVIVGGAVLTPQYAKEIGADFYAPDALAGVKIANALF